MLPGATHSTILGAQIKRRQVYCFLGYWDLRCNVWICVNLGFGLNQSSEIFRQKMTFSKFCLTVILDTGQLKKGVYVLMFHWCLQLMSFGFRVDFAKNLVFRIGLLVKKMDLARQMIDPDLWLHFDSNTPEPMLSHPKAELAGT